MRTDDFDYKLDESRIAQSPAEKRDESKLLVVDRKTGHVEHERFFDIKKHLKKGDLLVVNNTKVIPARMYGARPGKEEKIEILLIKRITGDTWECLVKPGKKLKLGTEIIIGEILSGKVVDITDDGSRIIDFSYEGIFEEILDKLGQMPLPPYITKKLEDRDRYQTVYAKEEGSAAAPTAGLHFTEKLIDEIKQMGVEIKEVTLHVGIGTFRPVNVEDVNEHKMHSEYYSISQETAEAINKAKDDGRRVIAVGTTTTRTLESAAIEGKIEESSGWTEIFIYPGFEFQIIDGLITNFHLPKSTLLMLVSAFSSKEIILSAYDEAIKNDYRFFSFGDAMLLI